MSLCRKPTGVNSGEKIKCQPDTWVAWGCWFVFCKERGSDVTSGSVTCWLLWALLLCSVSPVTCHGVTRQENMSRDGILSCNVYMCPALTRRCSMAALFDARALLAPASFTPGAWLPDMSSGQNKTIKIWVIKILCGDWGLEKLCWVNPQPNFQHWKLLTVVSKTFH